MLFVVISKERQRANRPSKTCVHKCKNRLSYGASPRAASDRDSDTAMHLAAQYNSVPFL